MQMRPWTVAAVTSRSLGGGNLARRVNARYGGGEGSAPPGTRSLCCHRPPRPHFQKPGQAALIPVQQFCLYSGNTPPAPRHYHGLLSAGGAKLLLTMLCSPEKARRCCWCYCNSCKVLLLVTKMRRSKPFIAQLPRCFASRTS